MKTSNHTGFYLHPIVATEKTYAKSRVVNKYQWSIHFLIRIANVHYIIMVIRSNNYAEFHISQ